jgi:hypothetical protein
MREISPQLLHPRDAHDFLLDCSQHLIRVIQKIKLEATSLNLQRDEGGDNSPTHINQKPNAFPGRPIADEKHMLADCLG